ncbi:MULTISPECIES: glycerophosphodiester phosphodiesterase [unclassified Modestobacter]|uniref:glycerophosphodiester phosphodiesterase n=1 Tax=unclassified Modestobacter TaxID=2643866 RepID=UPI0022AA0D8B|nr:MULTISPECIES: glycerophosphodiester phosphodiesterase [unclassified Modestobacter]MCZ2826153.1 glycerophosphodiester phosphodiesterase [Modestobacter sp. VKM Ac-2981]MCZ2852782.1 glycerophosphodiester phosphodiesterase [Modestobacter sp. VKM Ac-2982]
MDFADLSRPFVIAHRGGSLQVPEHTMEGYRFAVDQGLEVIEQDVSRLADGGLAVMHDGTVDRMTTSTGNVADHTSVSWRQLHIDASVILGGGWPDGLRPPLFEEVLTEFGNRVLLCAEAKSSDAMGPMIDALEQHGVSPESMLLQSFALADCRLACSRGWPVIWLGNTDVARAAAEGIGWIGPAAGRITPAVCTAAHAAGVEVATYTVNRRHQRDAVVAAGVDAIFSDDPRYIAGDACRRTSDLFADQTWLPGMLPDTSRGRFHPDDSSWGLDVSDTVHSTLMGFLAPPDPEAFTLRLDVRVDQTWEDSCRSGAFVFLSTDDHRYRPASGSSPGANGYRFLLRGDGDLDVHRVVEGVATTLASSTGGTAPTPDTYVQLRITVTPAGLSFARSDTIAEALTVADAAHRPVPVVHLGSAFAGVRFRNVVFT